MLAAFFVPMLVHRFVSSGHSRHYADRELVYGLGLCLNVHVLLLMSKVGMGCGLEIGEPNQIQVVLQLTSPS